MSGRGKRTASARSIRRPPRPSVGVCTDSTEHDSGFPVDSSTFEGGSFASRGSLRLINEVVSKFDSVKRDLVKSTGFQSILQFPVFKQFNRKFSLWLMSCVDERTSTLSIGEHIRIRFTKADVAHVIGTPASGKTILDIRFSTRKAKETVLNQFLPSEFKELRSIKLVQEVIERQYEYPMSKTEVDRFRVAFVVFVASNLLSPSAKYDYACVDYWNAIQDPDVIGSYDWSEYVIARLLEGVMKLKQDISSNIKFPNITGCSLFLQVLYLDSIHLEGLSKPHNTFPRIVDFSYDNLRLMILADRNYARYVKADDQLFVGKLRDPSQCIYSWATDHRFQNDDSRDACLFSVWEFAVAAINLLNIPLEDAGPIFVAAADFQEQINSGFSVTGTHAIKIVSFLVSIMLPYRRGFSYQSSYGVDSSSSGIDIAESSFRNGISLLSFPIRNRRRRSTQSSGRKIYAFDDGNVGSSNSLHASSCNQEPMTLEHAEIGDYTQRSVNSAVARLDDMPHKLIINLRVAAVMSQFYGMFRRLKPARDFDLNALPQDETFSAQSSSTLVCSESEAVASPWELGYSWCLSDVDVSAVLVMLNSIQPDDSLVIVHRKPKYIQVSLRALRAQILGKCEIELDLLDALTRTVIQEDDDLYRSFGTMRWRQYFESGFMESIFTGSFDLVDANLWNNLLLSYTSYDLSKCKLMFFPALLQFSWVCFTWNLENNVLYVFDPSHHPPIPDCRVEVIERCGYLLKLALQTLSRSVFQGIAVDVTSADLRILTLPRASVTRSNRTGVLCSLFCRCFDGHDLNPKLRVVDLDGIAVKLLKHFVDLKHNSGSFPPIMGRAVAA